MVGKISDLGTNFHQCQTIRSHIKGILLYFLILKFYIMVQYKYILITLSFPWNIGYVQVIFCRLAMSPLLGRKHERAEVLLSQVC